MKVGDIVKTKVPGFGTGAVSKLGTIISDHYFLSHNEVDQVEVMHEDGSFVKWYPFQLEKISDNL